MRETIRVGDTHYPVLKSLVRHPIERWLVGDPDRRNGGLKFQVMILPRKEASKQHLRALDRISRSHQNLPTIVRCHHHRDKIYLVTTWIEGRDLQHVLDRARKRSGKWPSVHQSCHLVRGLAHGLHHLNRQCSLVHGDIVPRNLIVTFKMRTLVLVDFGSAWAVERTARHREGDGLSPGYAAPERIEPNGVVDFRADQFSLSCVAYKLLTDRLPYDGLGGLAGTERYRDAALELIPPSKAAIHHERFPRRIWSKIDRLVCRGLALNPNDRYLGTRPWLDDWDEVKHAIEHPRISRPLRWTTDVFRSILGFKNVPYGS